MIGLDTLKIRLSDYKISASPRLRIKHADTDAETGEWYEEMALWKGTNGQLVKGTRAYYESDPSLDVRLGRVGGDAIEDSGVACWCEFSVPRRFSGSNFHAVGRDETVEVLRGVEDQLDEIGIQTNIFTAHISRSDTKNTIETAEPFECYRGLLDLIKVPRTHKRDYGTTFLWHNGEQQISAYDKKVEHAFKMKCAAKKQKIKFIQPDISGNWTNFEHRATNPKKVRNVLGIGLVQEIVTDYPKIIEGFRGSLSRYFFKHDVDGIVAASREQLQEEMQQYKAFLGRNWVQGYMKAEGLRSLSAVHGMDVVLSAMRSVVGTDTQAGYMKAYRLSKDLEKTQWDMALLLDNRQSQRTMKDLYCELKDKVLSPN
jgi:hypothetical protein